VEIAEPPHRWDLVTPDQLGSLPGGPGFPYGNDLIVAAGQVIARSGGGDLFFVGRSPDSIFDLLGGAFDGVAAAPGLHRLAFSSTSPLRGPDVAAARAVLARQGLTPRSLARGRRPVALVDLVYTGRTFTSLYRILRAWIDDEREPWNVIRRRLWFVGLTERVQTSPNAYRWQTERDWPSTLPARHVVNVSIDSGLWSYLGNWQVKLTGSFDAERWWAPVGEGFRHDDKSRRALGEAVGLVALGRAKQTRSLLVRTMTGELAYAESWLRTLVSQPS
jgi:hypothetical protein